MLKLPLHAISEEEESEGNSFSRASSGNSDNGFVLDSMMPSETVLESSQDKEKSIESLRPLFKRRNHSIPPANPIAGSGTTTTRHIARNVLSRLKKINLLDEEKINIHHHKEASQCQIGKENSRIFCFSFIHTDLEFRCIL
jgi:hypothetical protein